jgi:hypothetical protein
MRHNLPPIAWFLEPGPGRAVSLFRAEHSIDLTFAIACLIRRSACAFCIRHVRPRATLARERVMLVLLVLAEPITLDNGIRFPPGVYAATKKPVLDWR